MITSTKLQDAEAEVGSVRQNFGYINADRDDRIYVSSIAKFQHSRGAKLRFHAPESRRYSIRVSEVDSSWQHDDFEALSNAESSSALTALTHEEAIVSYDLAYDLRKRQPILVVQSLERQSTYAPSEWQGLDQLDPKVINLLDFSDVSQYDFGPDEVIALASFEAPSCDRRVILWLEPQSDPNFKPTK
ncbi:hypothetical protein [Rubripirellula reticaptiva]|uniref:hypothetical protein n=1 Tax=Rubripirellula reticaptiva TaxID=2528013 RepID=UPI0011B7B8B6|nr:hypothetical protein [Rubripirellula reticaptiva]